MSAFEVPTSLLIVLVGAIAVLAPLLKAAFRRISVPSLVGFLVLGIGLRLTNRSLPFLDEVAETVFAFLGGLGVVALLFRVGLELVPSLVVAVALTATSVGVAVAVWEERDLLKSESGQLLVDIAELDDISGLVLLAVLLGSLAEVRDGNGPQLLDVAGTAGLVLLKLGLRVGPGGADACVQPGPGGGEDRQVLCLPVRVPHAVLLHPHRPARALGDRAVPDAVYGAMVLVSAATCILAPVLLRVALRSGASAIDSS